MLVFKRKISRVYDKLRTKETVDMLRYVGMGNLIDVARVATAAPNTMKRYMISGETRNVNTKLIVSAVEMSSVGAQQYCKT